MNGVLKLHRLLILLIATVITNGCQLIDAPPAPESTLDVGAVETVVKTVMDELNVPGVAVGIVLHGEVVYVRGFGVQTLGSDASVTPESIFQLSSLAKTATSTAIMQLVEEGKIDLDAPVTEYLPYFRLADQREDEITVQHLLMHRSGLPDNDWADPQAFIEPRYDVAALEEHVRGMHVISLLYDPGAQFEYSGMGYEVLGDIIAKVSAQPYESYVAEHIFAPLAMQQTTLLLEQVDPSRLVQPHVPGDDGEIVVSDIFPYTREFAPDSTLYSNVEDMARYAIAHLSQGDSAKQAVLSTRGYEAMWTIYSQTPFPPPDVNYGYGWQIGEHQGQPVIGHAGIDIGYNSFVSLLPAQSAAVIVLTNYNDLEEFIMPAFALRAPLLDLVLAAEIGSE